MRLCVRKSQAVLLSAAVSSSRGMTALLSTVLVPPAHRLPSDGAPQRLLHAHLGIYQLHAFLSDSSLSSRGPGLKSLYTTDLPCCRFPASSLCLSFSFPIPAPQGFSLECVSVYPVVYFVCVWVMHAVIKPGCLGEFSL